MNAIQPAWHVAAMIILTSGLHSLSATNEAQAATAQEIKSFDDLLGMIPKDLARDLDKKTKRDAAALEISSRLLEAALGKPATLELQVESWRPWKDFVGAAYQLRPVNKEVRFSGVRFSMDMWVYVPASSGPEIEKLKRGSAFKTTGTIARADVTIDEAIRFHLTLKEAQIVPK